MGKNNKRMIERITQKRIKTIEIIMKIIVIIIN